MEKSVRNEPAVRVEAETGAVDWLLKQPGSRENLFRTRDIAWPG